MNPIQTFNNISNYLPILNGSILADIIIIGIVYYTKFFNSKFLMKWYETYRLSAVIADVLILVIGIILANAVFYYYSYTWSIMKFIGVLLSIQVIHDILFYIFFSSVPYGANKMFDVFKDYSKEVGIGAIAGDSFMIIIALLLSYYFSSFSTNTNILITILLVYCIPYIIYTK